MPFNAPTEVSFTQQTERRAEGIDRNKFSIARWQRWISRAPHEWVEYVRREQREYLWALSQDPDADFGPWESVWVSNVNVPLDAPLNTPKWANCVVRFSPDGF